MTESEWLACTDLGGRFEILRSYSKLTERKWRLFGVACCRRILHQLPDARSQNALATAENFADGTATAEVLDATFEAAFDVGETLAERKVPATDDCGDAYLESHRAAAWAACDTCHPDESVDGLAFAAAQAAGTDVEVAVQTDILIDIFGNPFRLITINPIWLNPTVSNLAQAAYDERAMPSGELDPARLAVLSDALEEAGCDDEGILTHLRSPGPHVRGCWVLDIVLGKE